MICKLFNAMSRGEQSASICLRQSAWIGRVIANDRASADQRLDKAARRFWRFVAEQQEIALLQPVQKVRAPPFESWKVNDVVETSARHLCFECGQIGSITDPARLKRNSLRMQACQARQPVERPFHASNPAHIDYLEWFSSKGSVLLPQQGGRGNLLRASGVGVIGAMRIGCRSCIISKTIASLQQRYSAFAQDIPNCSLCKGHDHLRQKPLQWCPCQLVADDKGFDPINPRGITPSLFDSFKGRDGGPIADDTAQCEAEMAVGRDSLAQFVPNRAIMADHFAWGISVWQYHKSRARTQEALIRTDPGCRAPADRIRLAFHTIKGNPIEMLAPLFDTSGSLLIHFRTIRTLSDRHMGYKKKRGLIVERHMLQACRLD